MPLDSVTARSVTLSFSLAVSRELLVESVAHLTGRKSFGFLPKHDDARKLATDGLFSIAHPHG